MLTAQIVDIAAVRMPVNSLKKTMSWTFSTLIDQSDQQSSTGRLRNMSSCCSCITTDKLLDGDFIQEWCKVTFDRTLLHFPPDSEVSELAASVWLTILKLHRVLISRRLTPDQLSSLVTIGLTCRCLSSLYIPMDYEISDDDGKRFLYTRLVLDLNQLLILTREAIHRLNPRVC
jgi:hypothetical protein